MKFMIYNMYINMFCFFALNFGFRGHYYRGVLPCNGYPFDCVALVAQGTLFLDS